MYFSSLTLTLFGLSATSLALPSLTPRACKAFPTISDPGFYASGSLPTADFPNDPSYFENAILEFQPTFASPSSQCTLRGNFERGFPVKTAGNSQVVLDVYRRHSGIDKTKIGSFGPLPLENGATSDIVSSPIATFECSVDMVFEFQVALSGAGAWASITFAEDAESGFEVLAC